MSLNNKADRFYLQKTSRDYRECNLGEEAIKDLADNLTDSAVKFWSLPSLDQTEEED